VNGFATWVEPEIEVLLRVAHSLTGSWADAEDVVQETLIRAYRAIDGFDGRHPRAWLLTILRRTHLNSLRRTRPLLVEDQTLERRRPAFGQAASVASAEDLVGDRLLDDDVEQAAAGPRRALPHRGAPRRRQPAHLRRGRGAARGARRHPDVAAEPRPRAAAQAAAAPAPPLAPTPRKGGDPMMGLTTCWWTARRLDRYLDRDPSALLSSADTARLERHADACRRCARELAGRREVREALRAHDRRRPTDVGALERLDALAASLRTSRAGGPA
jgi:RNA polymerase sigma factor (sigma-70 family)